MDRFTWTYRQFVGGNAALDLANTVIYPDDPTRRFDRIVNSIELGRWVAAGVRLAALPAAVERRFSEAERGDALRLRDAIDAVFRPIAGGGSLAGSTFADLLRSAATAIAGAPSMQAHHAIALKTPTRRRVPFRAHVAISALALAFSPEVGRVKACPACAWLFIDRSRNRRRSGATWKSAATGRNRKGTTRGAREQVGGRRDDEMGESGLLLAVLVMAGCSSESGPYLELQGGGFIFNYRIAEATVGLVAVPVRALPEDATVEASFENPAGGPPIVLDEKVLPTTDQVRLHHAAPHRHRRRQGLQGHAPAPRRRAARSSSGSTRISARRSTRRCCRKSR